MPKSNSDCGKRTPNFTYKEEMLLTQLVEKYKLIIENKQSGAVHWKDKEKAWARIEESFNAQNGNVLRSITVLKHKYANLKKKRKEKFSQNKKAMSKTGGGSAETVSINDVDERVKSLLGCQVDGLESVLDCDIQNVIVPGISNTAQDMSEDTSFENTSNNKDEDNVTVEEDAVPNELEVEDFIVENDGHLSKTQDWGVYTPNMIKTSKNKKLVVNVKKPPAMKPNPFAYKKINLNEELVKAKLAFVSLQQEKFLEEHKLKMEVLELKRKKLTQSSL